MKQLFLIVLVACAFFSCKAPELVPTTPIPYEVIPVAKIQTAKTEQPDSLQAAPTEDSTKIPIRSNGVFYALPRQRMVVNITVKKQEFIKGPYAEFAEKLLGVKTAIKNNYNVYSIDKVSVTQKSEVDPKQIYFVQFNDSELALEYGKGLIISKVNASKNKSSEQKTTENKRQIDARNSKNAHIRPMIYTDNLVEETDTIFSNQIVDTQTVQRYEIRTVKTEKMPQQKAEEIVENIAKIREDRNKVLTGFQEVNYEAPALQYMVSEFDRMENEYIQLFIGSTKISYETAQFEFLPEDRSRLSVELAGFSTTYGLISQSTPQDGKVKPIMLNIELNDEVTSVIEAFSQQIDADKKGFYYLVPSLAKVKISIENQLLFSKQMPFSQFGFAQALPPHLLEIEFSRKTGEIRRVKAIED